MNRFFSSIRHGRGSSLFSLLAPKPSFPSNATLRHHRFAPLSQNDGHVRGFSSENWGRRRNNLGQNANENVNARPDSTQGIENIDPRNGNNLGQNVNAYANPRPDFMHDKENIDSGRANDNVRGFSSANWGWRRNNLGQTVNAPPDFMQGIEDIESSIGNNLGENVNAYANPHPDFMHDKENIDSGRANDNVRGFSSANWGWRRNNLGQNANALPDFMQGIKNIDSRSGNNLGQNVNANANPYPEFMQDKENIDSGSANDAGTDRNSRPMDVVRGFIDKDNVMGGPSMYQLEHDADFVHIKMLRNNTFVTVTDSKGNVKLSGSAGSLKDMKSGQKLSRYAAEATAEVVGRRSRGLGLKSVVMKVNGFTHFRRKRQAIMSWKEGFTDSRGDRNPIVYVEDTTRKPHNGCRLPKKRRI